MKGKTEGQVADALNKLAEDMPLTFYKPPDDARNWKPADYLVWFPDFRPDWQMAQALVTGAAMIEVKDNDQVATLPFSEFRPMQAAYMRHAKRLGFPYFLVVWWRAKKVWTVSDARKVVAFMDDPETEPIRSVHFTQLSSNMGVSCEPHQLAGTIGAALRGELS